MFGSQKQLLMKTSSWIFSSPDEKACFLLKVKKMFVPWKTKFSKAFFFILAK